MNSRVVGYALLTTVGISAAVYSVAHQMMRGLAEAGTPIRPTIQVQLDPGEKLASAVVGDLTGSLEYALVLGTSLPGERGRIRVLHGQRDHYETVGTFTDEAGFIDSLIIQDITGQRRGDLITLWRSGQGGYLNVLIFEWTGQSYRKIWDLAPFEKGGQLTERALLTIRRIDQVGNVELVVRAPNVRPGERTPGPLPHQVSIYRWDAHQQTLVLFKRFVDPSRTFE